MLFKTAKIFYCFPDLLLILSIEKESRQQITLFQQRN